MKTTIMSKVFCVLLGLQLVASGCGEFSTAHCLDLRDEIATPPDMRKNYHRVVTPATDVAAECYCHVEEAAIAVVAVPVTVVFWGIHVVGAAGGAEGVGSLLDYLINQ